MSFFAAEALNEAKTGSFDINSFEVIPHGTKALAIISAAEWREADQHNAKHVSLTWEIVEGEFKGRKVFQKVKLFDADKAKALKAQKMLIAIDANCKGAIVAAGVEPTQQGLQSLLHSPMYILINVFTPKDPDSRPSNWVCAVSERKKGSAAPQQQSQQAPSTQNNEPPMDFDDDIPF